MRLSNANAATVKELPADPHRKDAVPQINTGHARTSCEDER